MHLRPTQPQQTIVAETIAGAGLETVAAVLDVTVDNTVDSFLAFAERQSANRQIVGIRYGYVPPGREVVPITPARVYD